MVGIRARATVASMPRPAEANVPGPSAPAPPDAFRPRIRTTMECPWTCPPVGIGLVGRTGSRRPDDSSSCHPSSTRPRRRARTARSASIGSSGPGPGSATMRSRRCVERSVILWRALGLPWCDNRGGWLQGLTFREASCGASPAPTARTSRRTSRRPAAGRGPLVPVLAILAVASTTLAITAATATRAEPSRAGRGEGRPRGGRGRPIAGERETASAARRAGEAFARARLLEQRALRTSRRPSGSACGRRGGSTKSTRTCDG